MSTHKHVKKTHYHTEAFYHLMPHLTAIMVCCIVLHLAVLIRINAEKIISMERTMAPTIASSELNLVSAEEEILPPADDQPTPVSLQAGETRTYGCDGGGFYTKRNTSRSYMEIRCQDFPGSRPVSDTDVEILTLGQAKVFSCEAGKLASMKKGGRSYVTVSCS